jgi:predicted SAM-dependent methyltransferase
MNWIIALPFAVQTLFLNPETDLVAQIEEAGLVSEEKPLKLHLGCGQTKLPGYLNIDLPSSNHTVQKISVADAYCDVTKLHFPKGTVDEVRNHHMFEHFSRSSALALLCAWQEWLKIGGKLHIETPDFKGCAEIFLNEKSSYHRKQIAMRHIFGSHEASWAVHWDGWYEEKFEHVLKALGFDEIKFEKIKSRKIPSLVVYATKKRDVSREELVKAAKLLLKESLVNETEEEMYAVWSDLFDQSFKSLSE